MENNSNSTPSPNTLQTRRSPRLHDNQHTLQEGVYKVTFDCRLKETVNQRNSSAVSLGVHVIHGNTWPEIKEKLWNMFSTHLQRLALLQGSPPIWSVSDSNPVIDMFDSYISLRNKACILTPWSSAIAHRYFGRNRNEALALSVYTWGNQLGTLQQLTAFKEKCIEPTQIDHCGAANQLAHQTMRDRLKEKLGNLLTGQEISWMLWAGYIVQKPTHEHDELIAKPPPSNLVRFFQPQSTSAQEHILRVQRSVTLAADVVDDGLLLNLAALRASQEAHTNLFNAELDQMEAMLTSKKSIIDAFGRDVAINPDDAEVLSALAAIPNQEDLDHA